MKIEVGDLELYESKSLILLENKTITFHTKDSIFNKITIDLVESEVNDDIKLAEVINIKSNENRILKLMILKKNYGGLSEFILIGNLFKRELFFNFIINELDSKKKLFTFNFFLGKEIEIEI